MDDMAVVSFRIAKGFMSTLRRLEMDAYEAYPTLIVKIHEDIQIWKRMCAKHGIPKELR